MTKLAEIPKHTSLHCYEECPISFAKKIICAAPDNAMIDFLASPTPSDHLTSFVIVRDNCALEFTITYHPFENDEWFIPIDYLERPKDENQRLQRRFNTVELVWRDWPSYLEGTEEQILKQMDEHLPKIMSYLD